MKYNKNILNNKVQILSTLCICVILLCVSLIVCIAPINLTYADTLTNSSALEFNQLSRAVNYSLTANFTSSGNDYLYQTTDVSFLPTPNKNHKYYFKANLQSSNLTYIVLYANNWSISIDLNNNGAVYSNIETFSRFYYYSNSSGSQKIIFTINVIDLTQMFGAGNEPTIEQINANNYFPTFYSYNAGTPLTNGEFTNNSQAFMNGYNSALSNYLNSIDTISAFSNSYANLTYATIAGYTGTSMTKGTEIIDGKETYVVIYGEDTLALAPFIVKGGTQIKLTFEYFEPLEAPQTSDYPIFYSMYAIQGNNLNEVWSYTANNWTQAKSIKNLSFVAPFDMNGLYIKCSTDFIIVNMTAEYTTNDLGLLISSSTESGYNAGYNDGYNMGYSEGGINALTTGKTWENAWSFISNTFTNIGNILDIKIFGDIPLWTFIAIPLLFGLIVFIFKMTGGN